MNLLHSALDKVRDRYAPVSHTSTFRSTGQITPEEFLLAGDYLVYKFPSWSWADASSPARRVNYLPQGKQFLVTRGVPCHKRLDDNFAGPGGAADDLVRDGFLGGPEDEGDDEGWLRTGGASEKEQEQLRGQVRTMTESGTIGRKAEEEEEDIPDMEDDDDDNEAIIRDKSQAGSTYVLATTRTRLVLTFEQPSPNIHSLHHIHTLLPHTTILAIRLFVTFRATPTSSHDGGHRW